MSDTLPKTASLSVVQIWVDLPRMHGFHRFLLIDVPRRRKLQLLHIVHLRVIELARSAVAAEMRGWIDGRAAAELVKRLRLRRKALAKQRHAGVLTEAVIARLEAQVAPAARSTRPQQIDMADFGDHRRLVA